MPDFDASNLTGIVALVVSILTAIIAWRKAPAEVRLTNADATGKISQAAATLADALQKRLEVVEADLAENCAEMDALKKHVKHLSDENDALRTNRARDAERITALEAVARKLQTENELLHDWARRLAAQVLAHGGEPEPFEKPAGAPARKPKFGGEW